MRRALIAATFCAGCTHVAPLPTYPLLDDSSTVAAVASQYHAVHDVSAQGDIDLTEASGDHVRLDIAVVLRPPNEARIRAWKFGQAVFDLTVTPDGAWLLTTGPGAAADRATKLQVSAGQLTHIFALLNGALFDDQNLQLREDGDSLVVRRERPGEPTVVGIIDRKTRTVRRYELRDEHDLLRLSLTQSAFADTSGIPWPHRIVAVSNQGQIDIQLRDVDLNAGLPVNVFVPPRRATRLP